MTLWTSDDAVAATGGRATRDFAVGGVSIDTRTIRPGDLFVALAGPNHDGHDYVKAAIEGGAAAALVHKVPEGCEGLPLLVVEPWVEQHLYNGCPTSHYPAADGRYRVRNAEGQFLGLANITGGVLKVEKLFVERN